MKSILDPSFRYTSSVNTDLAKTFARVRRELKQVARAPAFEADASANNVAAFAQHVRPAPRRVA